MLFVRSLLLTYRTGYRLDDRYLVAGVRDFLLLEASSGSHILCIMGRFPQGESGPGAEVNMWSSSSTTKYDKIVRTPCRCCYRLQKLAKYEGQHITYTTSIQRILG